MIWFVPEPVELRGLFEVVVKKEYSAVSGPKSEGRPQGSRFPESVCVIQPRCMQISSVPTHNGQSVWSRRRRRREKRKSCESSAPALML